MHAVVAPERLVGDPVEQVFPVAYMLRFQNTDTGGCPSGPKWRT
jgi:hypothetical protein